MKCFDLEYMLDPKPRHKRSTDAPPVGEEMGLLERLVAQTHGFDELVELLRQSPNGCYYAFAIAAVMRQHGPLMQRRVHAAVKDIQASRTTACRGDDGAFGDDVGVLDGDGGSGGGAFGVHTYLPARRVAATTSETAVPESIDEVHPG
ncbi:MAG: hypothetical protein AAFX99_11035, partial [Myxococcota bacterium]